MNILKRFLNFLLNSKQARRFYWTTFNGFIAVLIIGISEIDIAYAPFIVAFLQLISKEINNYYSM